MKTTRFSFGKYEVLDVPVLNDNFDYPLHLYTMLANHEDLKTTLGANLLQTIAAAPWYNVEFADYRGACKDGKSDLDQLKIDYAQLQQYALTDANPQYVPPEKISLNNLRKYVMNAGPYCWWAQFCNQTKRTFTNYQNQMYQIWNDTQV